MGTVPSRELGGERSRWFQRDGYAVHYQATGEGEPALLLMHGFGASLFSWHKVMEPLSAFGRVIAYDRPGFGITERPLPGSWADPTPYGDDENIWTAAALAAEAGGSGNLVLVGHSAGGRLAVLAALRHPDKVAALVLVAPALGRHPGFPGWVRALAATRAGRLVGPRLLRWLIARAGRLIGLAWHDSSRLRQEDIEGYRLPLQARDWDRGLWEVVIASQPAALTGELGRLQMPVLFITGDDDRIVPAYETRANAARVPNGRMVVISECGHIPHEERPELFLAAVSSFLSTLSAGGEAGQ
ncbi:MAG: alpha/beta hydrolase [Bacillota bacterium]|nr:alpha/beta hydrolase [Bacillota bacterium]